jgi:hypothetical protein
MPLGVSEDLASPSAFLSTAVTNYTGSFNAFKTALLSVHSGPVAGLTMVCVHYYKGGHWVQNASGRYIFKPTPLNPPAIDNIVGTVASTVPGSQRRRLHPG